MKSSGENGRAMRRPEAEVSRDKPMYAFIAAAVLGGVVISSRSTMLLSSVLPVAAWIVLLKSGASEKKRRAIKIPFAWLSWKLRQPGFGGY